ncbi:ATP-dependent DNA helicase [Trichonephila clavipes]|nr:ATP-dependent DNA helicase [Trichonephila clavipes]
MNACLKSSVLWWYVEKISLKTNMRVQLQQDESSERFAKQLLDIGNRKKKMDESTRCITLPENFCHIVKSTDELIAKVFPNLSQNYKNNQWVSERAILAAKNIDVNLINCSIQNKIPEEETTYKSIDTVVNQDKSVHYPIEFLNSLDLPGMPPHILSLKIGSPIILLRNINPPRLYNGTRLSVKKINE